MHKAVYDTRFFIEFFYSKDEKMRRKIREQKKYKEKYTSSVVLHEVYKFTLVQEGRETAKVRTTMMKKDFQIIPVDSQIAEISADLRQRYNLSMGDSMIAATASMLNVVCISDDPHFGKIKEIKTAWI